MPQRVEGPDQEELEYVSTGDTGGSSMALRNGGNPISVTATSDEDHVAGQPTACGDSPCNPKTTCSGISNGQRSACAPREDLKLDKERKPVPAVDERHVYMHAKGTDTCTELSHAAATSITEGECLAAIHEGNHDLHGKCRSKTKRRKLAPEYTGNRTTAERHKLVLAVLLSSLTWTAVMGSKEVKMATVSCSLSAAIPFIIVKHFRNDSSAVMVVYCGENYKPRCHSYDNCTMGNWDDQVVSFKCPEAMLKRGTFKLQSQEKDRFIPCQNSTVDNSTDTGAGQKPHTTLIVSIVSVVVVIVIIIIIIKAIIVYKRHNNRPEPVTPEGEE